MAAGSMPEEARRWRMNASIGDCERKSSPICGTWGRTRCCRDHQSRPARCSLVTSKKSSTRFSGQGAPEETQHRSIAISCSGSVFGSPFLAAASRRWRHAPGDSFAPEKRREAHPRPRPAQVPSSKSRKARPQDLSPGGIQHSDEAEAGDVRFEVNRTRLLRQRRHGHAPTHCKRSEARLEHFAIPRFRDLTC